MSKKKQHFTEMEWSEVRDAYGDELEDHLVQTLTGHRKSPHELFPHLYNPDELWFSKPDYRNRVLVNVGSKDTGFDTSTILRHFRLSGILSDYMCERYKIYPIGNGWPDPHCMLICSEAMKHKDITQYKLNIKNQGNIQLPHEAADQVTITAINKCIQDAQESLEAAKRLLGQYEKRRPKTGSETRRGPQLHQPSA